MSNDFAIAKTAIETDIEGAVSELFGLLSEAGQSTDHRFRCTTISAVPFLFGRPDHAFPFLFFHREGVGFYTSDDLLANPEILRPFLRGCLRAARDVWAGYKQPGLDFDEHNLFFRRPWPEQGSLRHQTIVLSAANGDATRALASRDLLIAAVGRRDEGLPPNNAIHLDTRSYERFLAALSKVDLTQVSSTQLKDRTVTTLTPVIRRPISPGSLSYDQWIRRLKDSPQGEFIFANLAGPQRIDGPAGSGKTLALVLKCLTVLGECEKAKQAHHAALVVFSEATRDKVLESFLLPLDSRPFHLRSRTTDEQSLTVTTLLRWSNEELEGVVAPYSLLTEDAAVARQDQIVMVTEILQKYFSKWRASIGSGLSPALTSVLTEMTPTLVSMVQHEFGVVIKGMADGEKRKYLLLRRPQIGLPCDTPEDRRFLYALFEEYKATLTAYGAVDLDDVAISHLKLLQMPLRPRRGFDTVFVDEAHSFNPNEIAVLSLLAREREAPKLVVSVDLPQALSDKGYDSGGLEAMLLHDVEGEEVKRFAFPSSYRCSQAILDLASSIYTYGANFYRPIRVPSSLLSDKVVSESGNHPFIRGYPSRVAMMASVVQHAERMTAVLRCRRSDVLIVLLYDELFELIPTNLRASSTQLLRKTDAENERVARRSKHFVLSKAEYVHGLEYEGVLLVGASQGDVPRSDPVRDRGATAVYEVQQVVDKLYLAITRARRQVGILYDRQPSFLLKEATDKGVLAHDG